MARPYKRELAYLESTGTQWIDTGIRPYADTEITCDFMLTSVLRNQAIFGSKHGDLGLFCSTTFNNDTGALYVNNAAYRTSAIVALSIQYSLTLKTTVLVLNSSSFGVSAVTATDFNIFLFARNADGTADRPITGIIYSSSISQNDALIRDFIPVLDNNDTPCMYDRVSKQLFYNQGTGEFLYGEKPKQVFPHIPCRFPTPTGDYSLNSLSTPLTFIAEQAGSTIQLTATGTPITSGLMYREGLSGKWYSYTIGTEITLASVGDGCQFRNTNTALSNDSSRYVQFVMSGKVGAYGNIQSMLNYSSSCPNRCFHNLFNGCTALTKAPLFPAMTLGNYCYSYTLSGSGIVESPELPALQLGSASYYSMCSTCTSLLRAKPLLVTSLTASCCANMFGSCSNLSEITVHFTEWAPSISATTNWLYSISSTGTFYKPSALSDSTRGESYIPRNWTVVNID